MKFCILLRMNGFCPRSGFAQGYKITEVVIEGISQAITYRLTRELRKKATG